MASVIRSDFGPLTSPGLADALRTILAEPERDAEGAEASRLADQAVAQFEASRDQQAALAHTLTDYALADYARTIADRGKDPSDGPV